MVQSFNLSGILNAFRLIANPSLAMPHIIVNDIREIPMASLKKHGIKAMAFDKDNCLTAPYMSNIHPPFKEAWDRCKDTFGKDNVTIVSNSAGTLDDENGKEAQALEVSLGVHVLRHTDKKPSGGAALMSHLKIPHDQIAFVGDRILTDIVYGNLNGNLTIWTKQVISEKGDNKPALFIRRLEHHLVKMLHHLDIKPSPHPFYTNKVKQ
ncbi:mitochondrial PGP phosphatase-domain-containing protein [Halteromyces radiatus]|uniref:mitochondrial PGP phosphatase-domain-containing protein n=1 Tax=Halteromyces radiatus TaxID=101107 RepID=UPI00221EF6CD|nr:mitochondrial PGP phosphatase-domain-containing protein [Halteromyces radiatus]KAI8089803.1 mitochondrial PGP phosphatase-domain-containing protein [Halteromyces radiatus]